MALPVLVCADPTAPAMDCQTTRLFGAPRGTPGRGNNVIAGIVIHGIQDTYTSYLNKMCIGSVKMPVGCHASMHYVIDSDTGAITQVVPENDVAWAFQSYTGNFPVTTPLDCCICPPPCPTPPCPPALNCQPVTYVGWPTLSAQYPNLSADFYTINIGVVAPSRPELTALDNVNCCVTPWGIGETAYRNLVRLVAWIESRYPAITLDLQHIAFHDQIVAREEGCFEFPCPAGCLICDVSDYCETCNNVSDPTLSIVTDNVRYVYVETTGGCRAKILLDDLRVLLNA